MHISKTIRFIGAAWQSQRNAIDTFRWIWRDLLPATGRLHSLIALGLMFVGMFISMQVVNLLNTLITMVGKGEINIATTLVLQIGIFWTVARLVLGWQNIHREWAWNRNTVHIPVRLTELQFQKTHGELKRTDSGISPEQIESAKDKTSNIQYAVLFEGSEALATLCSAFVFVCLNDWKLGIGVGILVITNLIYFFLVNHHFSSKIEQIDKDWRHAQAWTSERWVQFSLVKVTGMEHFVRDTVNTKLRKALDPDFKLWGQEYQIVDLVRSLVNIWVLAGTLLYGLYANWEAGLYAAMYLWLNFIKDQLWRIGSLQRHLIENTERVRKVQLILTSNTDFHFDEGEEYKPKGEINAV